MTKSERARLIKWANGLSDAQLEEEYYMAVFNSLGSEAEEMYERGYDISDILEREKHERDLIVISHVLERLCEERGIRLWDEEKP